MRGGHYFYCEVMSQLTLARAAINCVCFSSIVFNLNMYNYYYSDPRVSFVKRKHAQCKFSVFIEEKYSFQNGKNRKIRYSGSSEFVCVWCNSSIFFYILDWRYSLYILCSWRMAVAPVAGTFYMLKGQISNNFAHLIGFKCEFFLILIFKFI